MCAICAVGPHPQAFLLDALEAVLQDARFAGIDQRREAPLELWICGAGHGARAVYTAIHCGFRPAGITSRVCRPVRLSIAVSAVAVLLLAPPARPGLPLRQQARDRGRPGRGGDRPLWAAHGSHPLVDPARTLGRGVPGGPIACRAMRSRCVVETWIYNFGPDRLMQQLRVEDGVVVEIRHAGLRLPVAGVRRWHPRVQGRRSHAGRKHPFGASPSSAAPAFPFARAHGAYAEGRQPGDAHRRAARPWSSATSSTGERLGDVIAGAVLKHSKDFNLVRECVLSSGLRPADAGPRHAARLRHEPRGRDPDRQQDRARADRRRHRRRRRHDQRSADRATRRPTASCCSRAIAAAASAQRLKPWLGLRPRHFKPVMPGVIEPRTGLSMGQSCELMAKTWKITREAQDELAAQSHLQGGRGVEVRLQRRSGRAVPRARAATTTCAPTPRPRSSRSCRPVFDTQRHAARSPRATARR